MTTYDLWVQRTPKIEKAEWRQLVGGRSDLQEPGKEFAEVPEAQTSVESLSEFVWWHRSKGLPVRVAFITGAIHIEAGDADAWEFASQLATSLKGEVIG